MIFWTYQNFLKHGKIAKALTDRVAGAVEGLRGRSDQALAQRAILERQQSFGSRLYVAAACLCISILIQIVFDDMPVAGASTPSLKGSDDSCSAKQTPVQFDKLSLCRLDFLIKGKTCAVCLLGIQNRLQKMPGVVKAAVMLKAPYGASVLFDSKQISEKSISQIVTNNDKYTSLLNLKLTHITKVPIVFIPPVN